MKKLTLLSLLFTLTCLSLHAQVLNRGNFMLGSTVGFSTAESRVSSGGTDHKGSSARQINIAPSIGYFVFDKLAAGLGADYSLNTVNNAIEEKTESSNLLFGPFVRYYIPLGEDVAFFWVGNFGFGNSTDEQVILGVKQKIQNNVFAFGTGPGLTVYSHGGFAIETIFKYNYAKSTFDTTIGGVNTSTQTRTNQFSLSLGLQYYFGGFKGL
jgi:hypothetical protein